MESVVDDYYTCSICMEHFREPKTLPCLHSYCEACLREYIESRNYSAAGHFPCSLCRRETLLPPGGVSEFPTNFNLENIISRLRAASTATETPTVPSAPPAAPYPPSEPCPPPLYPQLASPYPAMGFPPPPPASYISPPAAHYPHPTAGVPYQPSPASQPAPPVSQPATKAARDPVGSDMLQRRLRITPGEYAVPVKHNIRNALLCFGQYGTNLTDFTAPVGLAVVNQGLLITDQRNNRVMTFSVEGQIQSMFTCQGLIHSVCASKDGSIIIANSKAEKALAKSYSLSGKPMNSYGQQFTYEKPHGIAVSSQHIAVSTTETNRVILLDHSGKMLKDIGGTGSRKEQFRRPLYLAFNLNDDLVVSDSGNHAVKIVSTSSKHKVMMGGVKGSKPGQFDTPLGVAIDKNNNIYVADSNNMRIQCFSSKGKFLCLAVESVHCVGDAVPRNVAVLGDDRLAVLVAGSSHAEVQIYPVNRQSKFYA